jgi:Zn-dependent M16 (insulinase) family peptidase
MTVSHGFELRREEKLPEIHCLARLYHHGKTGAELLSLIAEDENKVFGVSFRTPPSDSTGIAHILEHSVLCGSRKYPVKAPFLEMLKSSLNTFLNAMTYPDKTVYPVASTNLQDFYNLVDVYLDAVLHPRITPDTLRQEGWHYELESPEAPLIYKGVVFNEMKGNYSSPDVLAYRLANQSLYPDTTYGVDAGGDPQEIPNLTFEAFKTFHQRLYHPSNAKFFFYGDDDPERRLEILSGVLDEFSRLEIDSSIALQPHFEAPRKLHYTLPSSAAEEGARQARITVNWMIDEISNVEDALALSILSDILVGKSASPLRKALIDSGLGDDITGTGLDTSLRQMRFGAGLKGIDANDADKVEALILDTLRRLAEHGIDPLTVEASVNTSEFRLRENNTGMFPRGLTMMLRALQFWNYDRDPLAPLVWEGPLDALKSRLSGGERVFETLIRTRLLDNPHRTTVLFTPDPEQAQREAREEREKLDAIRAAMSENDVEAVIEQTRALKRKQEAADTAEALATLPRLTLQDLDPKNTRIPIETGMLSGAPLVTHDLPTNGIVYLDIGLDLRQLPADLLPFTGLFRRALLETGAGGLDMVQLSQRIGRSTGGVSVQSWTSAVIGGERSAARLFLRSKAMPDKAGELAAILQDVLLSARLDDRERLAQILNEERARLEARLVPVGHQMSALRLRSSLTEADWAAEQMGGVSYLQALRRMAADAKENPAAIAEALERIRSILLRREAMVFNVTAEGVDLRRIEPELTRLAEAMPQGATEYPDWVTAELPRFEGLTIPAKVNYVAKGDSLPKLGHAPGGAALVASHWLRGAWLWDKVRVQGGAYGAFSSVDLRSGTFSFGSYRDPNLLETIAVYDGAGAFLRSVAGNATDLERAIIGTIGAIDTYRLPDAKGFVSLQRHLAGDSEERLQEIRDEVLGAGPNEMRRFAAALDAVAAHGRVVVLGSEEAIQSANAGREDRFTVTKLL